MAKQPKAGAAKRRLARGIGNVRAVRFYRTVLGHTLLRLGSDPRWRTYLAVSPDSALDENCWPGASRIVRLQQGHGDLGARMQRLFDAMPPGPVVVVGSDIPAMSRAHIADAFGKLGRADAVFGPARDGGYWLVGLKQSPRRLTPFENVPWSTPDALSATCANLKGRKIALAATLTDVDTAEDWSRQRGVAGRLCLRAHGPA
ncbi:TIGR04282 family arsenosugar biosynthesis glycosyltransferase [Methyloceanibacter sp.]|uniref:TIGR04282 family arsenosugar biosynthesis glycosyltransferase n=1 Tax=Methyloceanibacter sp. TaxID=1965321 RepID=UPI002CBD0660|nr:TIGR04282 family arsenosugar biosynthesis glycosyltransferase [Methyloceanibacter sp.]HML90922.1 TIGR04282 family arsenosugar biosynthesis glycosyltransferase [Methyloceanibacter sp.]